MSNMIELCHEQIFVVNSMCILLWITGSVVHESIHISSIVVNKFCA